MPKSSKPRRSREEYRRLLALRSREGLTYPELSERTGVPLSTLQEWGRKLRVEEQGRDFVEVAGRLDATRASHRIEIVVRGGRRLRVPMGTPAAELRELVALLESC